MNPPASVMFARRILGRCAALAMLMLAASAFGSADSNIIGPPTLTVIVFDPPPGGPYWNGIPVSLSAPEYPDGVIHFTIDGSDPVSNSPVLSGGVIGIYGPTTIKAAVFGPEGDQWSWVEAATYSVTVDGPRFSPSPISVTNGSVVSIFAVTAGATLSYLLVPADANGKAIVKAGDPFWLQNWNLNGYLGSESYPEMDWQPYSAPILITSNVIVFALAEKEGYGANAAVGAFPIARLPRPMFDPPCGPVAIASLLAITSSVPDVEIHYTLDNTDPTTNSAVYSEPIRIEGQTRLRAKAFKEGWNESHGRSTFYRTTPPASNHLARSLDAPRLKFTQVARFDRPVWVASANDGTDRLFVMEAGGTVWIVGKERPFLALSADRPPQLLSTSVGISIAIPPDYDSKACFYVSYRPPASDVVRVSRFTALQDRDAADANSEELIGHWNFGCNGGQLVFSEEGILYLNLGGPIANTTLPGMSQDLNALSGKMIPILSEGTVAISTNTGTVYWPFSDHFAPNDCATVGGIFWPKGSSRMSDLYLYGNTNGDVCALKRIGTNWNQNVLARPRFGVTVTLNIGEFGYELRPFQIKAIGEDDQGRLYLASYGTAIRTLLPQPYWHWVTNTDYGAVYRIEDDLTQFAVQATIQSSQDVILAWYSTPELNYQPQVSSNLTDWAAVGPPLPGTGALLSTTNAFFASPIQLFFRVLAGNRE